jgi:CHAT domain-containing protein
MTTQPITECPGSEILGAFAEGLLTPAERRQVVEHVDRCARCQAEVAALGTFAGETAEPGRSGLRQWWLAAAAAVVVVLGGAFLFWRMARPGNFVAPLVAAAEPLGYRPIEARLTGGFRWAEFRGAVRSTTSEDRNPKRLKLAGAAGESLQRAEQDRGAGAQHAAAIAALLIEDPNGGIERLRKLTADHPLDASAWNDLAAAHLDAAVRFGHASELPLALAAVDRALRIDPKMPEALFNRALIVERIGLIEEARQAWQQFLTVDPASEWAREARARLDALPRPRTRSALPTRPFLEVETLGRWGEAMLRGSGADADRQLAIARDASPALATSGERLLADAVAAIDAAGGDDRRQLAMAHVAYRTSRLALSHREADTARRDLERAASLFAGRSAPGELMARYYMASADYVAGRIDETERELVSLRADPRVHPSYKALRAQLAWQYGLTQARLARWPAAIESYRAAQALFDELGEQAPSAFLDTLIAEGAIFLGRRDEAWERWSRSLRALSLDDFDDRLAVTLGTMGRAEWIAGNGDAARSLLDIEIRHGAASASVTADALLRRTILSARLSDAVSATAALGDSERAVASIEDADARAAMSADLRVAEGIVFAAGDPQRALAALTQAVDDYGKKRRVLLPVALFERGRVLRSLHRIDDATNDLRAAASALEEQRDAVEWRDVRSGALDGADQIYTTLAELLLERGANAEALAAADRGTGYAFYGAAAAPRKAAFEEPRRASFEELRKQLAPDALVVEYLVLPRQLVAFAVDARGIAVRRVDVTSETLTARVAALDAAIRDRSGADAIRRASVALDTLLVAPLRDAVDRARSITFVPPPLLASTPFAALLDARTGRWLIEDHTIRIATSAMPGSASPAVPALSKIVVIHPSAGGTALPSAAAETQALLRIYPNATLIEGRDASAAGILDAIAAADIVHYAGHVDGGREAGLVLRSENGRDELLYSADVARRRLRRAPLIVLAGCRTLRGGASRADFSASLAQAFLLAGARAVIGTSWDVDDDTAGELFARLHTGLAASPGLAADPAAALRDAQLSLLHKPARDVADWAAAQIVVRHAVTTSP